MPHDVPTGEPTTLTAGESWSWDINLSDHPPSDGWTLKYALRGPTDKEFTAGTGDETYELRVTPSDSGAVAPGTYRLIGYVEKGSDPVTDREVIYDATLVVRKNPLATVNAQTHAEETLAVIEAAIEGRLDADEEEFEINGRAVKKIRIAELYRLRNRYRTEVMMERNPGQTGPRAEVRFAAPS